MKESLGRRCLYACYPIREARPGLSNSQSTIFDRGGQWEVGTNRLTIVVPSGLSTGTVGDDR